jgi:hypothetical protein
METFVWKVRPLRTPAVTRRCSKCGSQTEFISSDKFRVNANKRLLDVWLVYKCKKCDTTWNLTVLSRISADRIDPEMHYGFEKNDKELAWRYAFNMEALQRAAAVVNWDDVDFEVDGECAVLSDEPVTMRITADYAIPVRLDKIIMRMTGLSRSKLKQFAEKGMLALEGGRDVNKARFDGNMTVCYIPKEDEEQ